MDPFELNSIRRKKERKKFQSIVLVLIMRFICIIIAMLRDNISKIREVQFERKDKTRYRLEILSRIIRDNDVICKNELRVNRKTFVVLCEMVRDIGGLHRIKNMQLEETVAMFLYTLAHHKKNRSIGNYFLRSGESVSRKFNLCLLAVLKLHRQLLKKAFTNTQRL